jgi:endonuclease YncB( thermonuclease family)
MLNNWLFFFFTTSRWGGKMLVRVLLLSLISLLLIANSYAEVIGVVEVVDGDTLSIEQGGNMVYVGVLGVDAPEVGQPFYEDAKKFVSDIVQEGSYNLKLEKNEQSQIVKCKIMYHAKNGAYRDLSASLLFEGLAYYNIHNIDESRNGGYEISSKQDNDLYTNSEKYAKKNKLGVWGSDSRVFPWDYRKIKSIVDPEVEQAIKKEENSPRGSGLSYAYCQIVNYDIQHEFATSTMRSTGTTINVGDMDYSSGVIVGGKKYKRASYMQIHVKNITNEDRAILPRDIIITTIKGNKVSPLNNDKFFIHAHETAILYGLKFKPGISGVANIEVLCR